MFAIFANGAAFHGRRRALGGVAPAAGVLFLAGSVAFAPALAELARAAMPGPAQFDGVWTIDATTTSFFCPLKRRQLFAAGRSSDFRACPACAQTAMSTTPAP